MRSLYYDVHAYKSETRNLRGEKIPSPPKRRTKEEYRPSSWRLASQIERAATEARVKAGMAPEIRNLAQAHEMARGPPPARVVKASPPAQSLEMELLVSGAFDGFVEGLETVVRVGMIMVRVEVEGRRELFNEFGVV